MAGLTKYVFPLNFGEKYTISSAGGSIFSIRSGINAALGLYLIPLNSSDIQVITSAPGADGTYYSIEVVNNDLVITNMHNGIIYFSSLLIPLG